MQYISKSAIVGLDVKLGENTVIEDNVKIGEGYEIGSIYNTLLMEVLDEHSSFCIWFSAQKNWRFFI